MLRGEFPSKRLRDYRETVVGCGGNVFTSLHVNNKWGTFLNGGKSENVKTIRAATRRSPDGFTIELSIPFKELPNYMLGNAPKPGEKIFFALVRTDKSKEKNAAQYYSAFPLLYDGHNIFGYAEGTLNK